MATDIIETCVPIEINGHLVAEVEVQARIVSPSPMDWEISLEVIGRDDLVSLDDIQPCDPQCDLKAGLRTMVEDHLWKNCQDAIDAALHCFRVGTKYRQRADARLYSEAAE